MGGDERLELKIGEEQAIHLPPGAAKWTVQVEGMASAVAVRKLWAADPYPEDDEDERQPKPPPDTVFMVRAIAPGSSLLRFVPEGAATAEPREIQVTVRM
jgi:hypothetical protein